MKYMLIVVAFSLVEGEVTRVDYGPYTEQTCLEQVEVARGFFESEKHVIDPETVAVYCKKQCEEK